jgi:glycosyltransferase involved in cell wall biosynthesis
MTRPLVSVVVPAYNAERYLRETLESALAQDWHPFEVIVVDDGSTDRTAEIAESYDGVRCIRRANGGAAAARNTGLEQAHGELVANLDSDDLLPPTRLRVQAEHLVANPKVGCVFGRQEWLNPPQWLARDSVYGDLDGIPLNSAMFRRDVLLGLGGYDEAYARGEDLDLVVRMRERGIEFDILPDVVVYRRHHDDSLSADASPHENLIRSLRAKLERTRE